MNSTGKYELLKDKNYLKLWIAQIITIFGDWTYYVAMAAMFYNFTQSSEGIVKLRSTQTVALILVSPLIGVVVDRLNRKYLMIFSDLASIGVLLLLLLFPKHLIFYIVGVSISIADSLFGTAKSSLLPDVIKKEQLVTANSISSTTSNLMLIFGGALGGLIVATGGYRLAFVVNILTCIISATLVSSVNYNHFKKIINEDEKDGYLENIKKSFKKIGSDILYCAVYLRKEKAILAIILMFILLSFGAGAINVLTIVFANQVLNVGTKGYGLLLTIQGIGSLVAGTSLIFLNRRFNPFKLFSIGFLLMGLSMTLLGFTNIFIIATILFFVSGFGNVLFLVTSTSVMQKIVLPDLRGKVFSVQNIMSQSALLLGMVFTGFAENIIGTGKIITIGGSFELIGAIFCILFFAKMNFQTEKSLQISSVE